MRSVCGCMPANLAATEIMKTPWSSPNSAVSRLATLSLPARTRQQIGAWVAVHHLRKLLDRLLLLLRERLRDLDPEAVVDVATATTGDLRRALAAQALDGAVARAGRHPDLLGAAERRHLHGAAGDR